MGAAIIMQDGAYAHTSNSTHLDAANFWSKLQWPPSSPDANPLDFSFWNELTVVLMGSRGGCGTAGSAAGSAAGSTAGGGGAATVRRATRWVAAVRPAAEVEEERQWLVGTQGLQGRGCCRTRSCSSRCWRKPGTWCWNCFTFAGPAL